MVKRLAEKQINDLEDEELLLQISKNLKQQ